MSTSKALRYVRGVPIPNVPWFPEKNAIDAMEYVPHDGDVIICSYPKTGTSWLQFIVEQIMSKGKALPNFMDLYYKVIPFMEMAGIDAVEALQEPRIYKHHFASTAVKKNDKAKYLYIYRNPEDVFISYYYFFMNTEEMEEEPISIDDFLDLYLEGKVWYGNYCDHVLSYLHQEDNGNFLIVTYENLISNRREEVLRIAKFLGEEHYEDMKKDETILDNIIEHTEFEYMKKNVAMVIPEMPKKDEPYEAKDREINYFRKGTVGDGKKSLTEAQLKKLREHVATKMGKTRLIDEWLPKQ